MRKIFFLALSLPIGVALTASIVWLFGLEIASEEKWVNFPEGWRIYDLVMNATALIFLLGSIHTVNKVLNEVWGSKTDSKDRIVETGEKNPPGGEAGR